MFLVKKVDDRIRVDHSTLPIIDTKIKIDDCDINDMKILRSISGNSNNDVLY